MRSTQKKECQNSSDDANLSVTDYDDTMVQTGAQFKNVAKYVSISKLGEGHYSLRNDFVF